MQKNRYVLQVFITRTYRAVIEADNLEEAGEIGQAVDLDDCVCDEETSDICEVSELDENEPFDLPIFRQEKGGYELVN